MCGVVWCGLVWLGLRYGKSALRCELRVVAAIGGNGVCVDKDNTRAEARNCCGALWY